MPLSLGKAESTCDLMEGFKRKTLRGECICNHGLPKNQGMHEHEHTHSQVKSFKSKHTQELIHLLIRIEITNLVMSEQ